MYHPARISTLLLFAAALLPAPSNAQQPAVGSRVRVTAKGTFPVVGTLVALTPDSIAVAPVVPDAGADSVRGPAVSFARTAVRQLDVQIGTHRNLLEGTAIGFVSGAVLGGVLGAVSYRPCTASGLLACFMSPTSRSESAKWGAVAGVAIAVPLGAIFGALTVSDVWMPAGGNVVSQLRIAPRGNGVGAELSFAIR